MFEVFRKMANFQQDRTLRVVYFCKFTNHACFVVNLAKFKNLIKNYWINNHNCRI